MKGRKKTPTKVLQIRGTHRKSRHKEVTPADDTLMVPPGYLPARAAEIFHEIYEKINAVGYADASHSAMLGLLALTLHEIEQLTDTLKDSLSYKITNSAGDILWKARPEQRQRAEAIKRAQSLLSEFCLSAGSAGKINIKTKKNNEENDMAKFETMK